MALIGGLALTYADWATRVDDQGKIATIINLLSQTNEILDDALVVEGNQPSGHMTTVRTGLPNVTWRLLNYGVVKSKSTTAKVLDTCGMLETYSEIDKDLADMNGNSPDFRLSEDLAFLEAMNQSMAQTIFYGNTTVNAERFMGLAPRYNTVNKTNAANAANVIDLGGTGSNNTSIWIIVWGPNTCHMTFPKGKTAGLQQRDLGEEPLTDANGNMYRGYRTQYKWDAGLVVRDWRFVVRICNIDVNTLIGDATFAPTLINALIRGVHRLPVAPAGVNAVQTSDANMTMGRTAIYCNRTIRTYLDIQSVNKANVLLKISEVDGKVITSFRGIPIRTCDQILNTEARVV